MIYQPYDEAEWLPTPPRRISDIVSQTCFRYSQGNSLNTGSQIRKASFYSYPSSWSWDHCVGRGVGEAKFCFMKKKRGPIISMSLSQPNPNVPLFLQATGNLCIPGYCDTEALVTKIQGWLAACGRVFLKKFKQRLSIGEWAWVYSLTRQHVPDNE